MKKDNKGITLVALIITIIVLLILAVVTISAVNGGNLFAHANNAATTYSQKAEEENSMISSYISKMEQYDAGSNPLIGKIFSVNSNESSVPLIKNITATTFSVFDFDEEVWHDNMSYTYDSTTNTVIAVTPDSDEITLNTIILPNNIILVNADLEVFVTSNGPTGTSLLDGYSFEISIDEYNFEIQLGPNNTGTAIGDATQSILYDMLDDNSSNNGTYALFINILGTFELTKVNGVYTQISNKHFGTISLTPPQP